MSTAVLYTPEVLSLTIRLAAYPLVDDLKLRGEARSKSCGSTIMLGLSVTAQGAIDRVGLRSQACAIGQASAAIFATAAVGRTAAEIVEANDAIIRWLSGGTLPVWPGMEIIRAARDYPARHGAVLLPWQACLRAFEQR